MHSNGALSADGVPTTVGAGLTIVIALILTVVTDHDSHRGSDHHGHHCGTEHLRFARGIHPDIVAVVSVAGRNPGGASWMDSYSVGDRCYYATTFDHNIGEVNVDTPAGAKTVRQVCRAPDDGPGP